MRIVVALGGNALLRRGEPMTADNQRANIRVATEQIAKIHPGNELVIAHGNGPQVGLLSLQAAAYTQVSPYPLDVLGAETEGMIGYIIEQELGNLLDFEVPFATLLTQVEVDANDPAFQHPTKPIGGFMDEAEAKRREAEEQWVIVEDAGRGWRRVVASPIPQKIIELDAVQTLMDAGIVVITVGGGGIPVIETEAGDYVGTAAVIDKDFASSLLAREIHADLFVISTAVEKVYINYNKPDQRAIDVMTVSEAKRYIAEGHFAKGSMLPKIQACIMYLEAGGKEAIITDPEHITAALRGETGTRIIPG